MLSPQSVGGDAGGDGDERGDDGQEQHRSPADSVGGKATGLHQRKAAHEHRPDQGQAQRPPGEAVSQPEHGQHYEHPHGGEGVAHPVTEERDHHDVEQRNHDQPLVPEPRPGHQQAQQGGDDGQAQAHLETRFEKGLRPTGQHEAQEHRHTGQKRRLGQGKLADTRRPNHRHETTHCLRHSTILTFARRLRLSCQPSPEFKQVDRLN
ncbi:hypothetical protein C3B61_09180 [Cryobacterium zongtaii]|uniref:Uncharacterized protein n=1 Tax=Cryobacterium zongtaii TaxID=1259217 RepID=A0A2S3ZH53_9MICO|nr:hypothetical protein [Cryobacterium zongtaii]POH66708.1 hypothetical protein C3B61_09180 [Cryobacterium zongtaii]